MSFCIIKACCRNVIKVWASDNFCYACFFLFVGGWGGGGGRLYQEQCDQSWQFFALGQPFKAGGNTYFTPKQPQCWAIFVKVSKSLIFLVNSFFGNFYRHLAIFIWSHWSPTLIARPGFIYSHNVISLNNTLGVGSRLLFMRYDNVTAYASPQPRAILVEGSLTTHPLSCTVREGKYFLF